MVIEIWNLVFMQFSREADRSLKPLPNKHVDTGMGLERITSILQKAYSNYDTDVFEPIFAAIQKATGAPAYARKLGKEDTDNVDMAYRVVADHLRTLTFAITDGAVPSSEGRGYVLRRVLRRAVRYGRQVLKGKSGFFSTLVPTLIEHMKDAFPEITKHVDHVISVIQEEEKAFERTLDRGLELFAKAAERSKDTKVVTGEDAFTLYDTYGFPVDLTQLMAEERGFTVDMKRYHELMEEAKDKSRGQHSAHDNMKLDAEATDKLLKSHTPVTDDSFKYTLHDIEATVQAIWNGKQFVTEAKSGDATEVLGVVMDRSNFYAEAGGQVYDTGVFRSSSSGSKGKDENKDVFRVDNVQSYAGYVLHVGKLTGNTLKVGDRLSLHVDLNRRRPIMSNHTSTHILNYALREVLGTNVEQKGSLVDAEKLRFDFLPQQGSHY